MAHEISQKQVSSGLDLASIYSTSYPSCLYPGSRSCWLSLAAFFTMQLDFFLLKLVNETSQDQARSRLGLASIYRTSSYVLPGSW